MDCSGMIVNICTTRIFPHVYIYNTYYVYVYICIYVYIYTYTNYLICILWIYVCIMYNIMCYYVPLCVYVHTVSLFKLQPVF